jgi:hypothetical protein
MKVEKYNLLTENNLKFPKYKPNLKYLVFGQAM